MSALPQTLLAFHNSACVASGPLPDVAIAAAQLLADHPTASLLFFDADTAEPVDLDLRGGPEQIRARFRENEPISPQAGRPRLGVVPREVTLLPRHWDWLNAQPGGASAALRRLVEEARKANHSKELRRESQNRAYRLMTALAGNLPGYEEAVRALFAGSAEAFDLHTAAWPPDVVQHARRLAREALA